MASGRRTSTPTAGSATSSPSTAAPPSGTSGRPACTFAFEIKVIDADTYGAYCSSWAFGGTTFTDYTAADFWWSDDTVRDGWGWADAYTYVGTDGTEFDLEKVLFDHFTYTSSYATYNGWYFRAFNFPDRGIAQVTGDAFRSEFEVDLPCGYYYYYFYY